TNTVTTSADFQDSLDVVAATANGNLLLTNPANILAGQTRAVGVKANLAGSLDATVALALGSNTNGVTGLVGETLAGQSIAVTGAAYDYAVAAVTNRDLDFGNVRKGGVLAAQSLAFANTLVTDAAFQDQLLVATSANNAKLTATGALVTAGTSADLTVAASTATAGTLADALTVALTSKAAAQGLSDKDLGTLNVVVTGGVYDYAQADFSAAPLAFGNVRKGATGLTRTVGVTNTVVTNAAFQDSLDVTGTVANAKLSASALVNTAAGLTGDVTVTASTALAGSLADTLNLAFVSNANGVAGLTGQSLTGGTVAITGAVYDLANAAVAPTLTFGNVRTGAVGAVGVTNAAITSAQYQDSLDVTATSANARLALTNPATIAADAAGDVTVRAATAGSLDATLSVGLVSNSRGVTGLDDVTLGAQSVTVTGAAYDLARATLASTTLALGNVRTGTQAGVAVTNTVTTSADFQDSLDVVAATANGNLLLTNPANI
ncbi:MAG: choice-of-anchor D domain-containing protein, partial [Verrucomicrobia bacterium]|nr:choice-of-anchor D domain-containing protein [Verrucomicrobiota bacterium]